MTSATNHESLQGLIGRALVDPTFRKDLLNGHRAERLAELEQDLERRSEAADEVVDLQMQSLDLAAKGLIEGSQLLELGTAKRSGSSRGAFLSTTEGAALFV